MMHAPVWLGDAGLVLISLLIQGVPFLLLGALVGGVITAFVPVHAWLGRWSRAPFLSACGGALFALFLPACDCAVVPVVRRLVQKGVPLSAGIAYLLAAPALNPICLLSTWLAYRFASPWHMVALRAGGTFLLALAIGLIAGRIAPERLLRGEVLVGSGANEAVPAWMEPRSTTGRGRGWLTALSIGVTDFINVTTLYVLGAACSALLQTTLPLGTAVAVHGWMGVPVAMALAFLLSLCSTADAFVVNSFGALGLSAQLAFLWFGPICNLRALFVYRNVFQYRAILGLFLVVASLIFALAGLVHLSRLH
jgi:uncharacterized membrane protein YraQ (UPF0718 family)